MITNVPSAFVQTGHGIETRIADMRIEGLAMTYGTGDAPVALIGSWNLLEIAVPGGSAAQAFGCRVGASVTVERADA